MARKPDIGPERAREAKDTAQEAGKSLYQTIADVVLTGIVVIVPLVITLYILQSALGFIPVRSARSSRSFRRPD